MFRMTSILYRRHEPYACGWGLLCIPLHLHFGGESDWLKRIIFLIRMAR